MHEISLMQSALSMALELAKSKGATHIHRMTLSIGELSGVVPDALAFAFDVVSAGTLAEGAELTLETVPTLCYCPHCWQEFHPTGWVYECPRCHHITHDIRQGQALELASLEVS
ncbi:MAG: hydrogenase maturation nickel metallochaperone HypA [Cyanobacteria bacterium P01_E01_bin.6]